jgi:Helix-turn-helix domain
MDDRLLTQTQAAEILNVSPRTLEGWRRKNCGPSFIVYSSRCVRYSERILRRWLETRVTSTRSREISSERHK